MNAICNFDILCLTLKRSVKKLIAPNLPSKLYEVSDMCTIDNNEFILYAFSEIN